MDKVYVVHNLGIVGSNPTRGTAMIPEMTSVLVSSTKRRVICESCEKLKLDHEDIYEAFSNETMFHFLRTEWDSKTRVFFYLFV